MTAKTSRTFYDVRFKVSVLDELAKTGEMAEVARNKGLKLGLVYGWKQNEETIRKAFALEMKAKPRRALRLAVGPAYPVRGDAKPKTAHPDGPKMIVRGMGPWLRKVVREEFQREMPDLLIDAIVKRLEERVDDLVEKKLEAMFMRKKLDAG